ncbi:hypothetical protein HanRHA438_Chr10g0474741 [Helianthus annuus]|nr:hypothetical protein HanRHA438_Chr10g0474741 [Helianthus annuus]
MLRNIRVYELFMNTYRTRFYVCVRLLRICFCSCLFVNLWKRKKKLTLMNTNGNK